MKEYTVVVVTTDEFDAEVERLGKVFGMQGNAKLKMMLEVWMQKFFAARFIDSCIIKYKTVKKVKSG